MKKWYWILAGLTIVLAVSGAVLALTEESGALMRSALGRGMIGASVAGLALCMLFRTRAKDGETAAVCDGRGAGISAHRSTFSDVAANEEARKSLEQIRDYILQPEKYSRLGARMPKGVLLYGPPGTGKTLLARALAGEAGVPFFALSGSDFVEKYVGVGAKRVRELFRKARKAGKCVIFIDEIDAMGKRRSDNSSDERDQTLNALLSEMSGFHSGDGVVVIAATNRMEMLDPALLRPGRFDRQIEVALPGKQERLSILKLHSRNKPLGKDVHLESIAAQTAYFSGASLENLMNEAAILAANDDVREIAMHHIQSALIRTIVGADRKSAASESERRIIALHEAGHAIAAKRLTPLAHLARVSILPAGRGAAGYNLTIRQERILLNKQDLENEVCVLLAGRAAEMLVGGADALTSGAANDLERAAEVVSAMVCEFGMDSEPAVSVKTLSRLFPAGGQSDGTVRRILGELFERTMCLMKENEAALIQLADALLKHDTLEEKQIDSILAGLSNGSADAAIKDKI